MSTYALQLPASAFGLFGSLEAVPLLRPRIRLLANGEGWGCEGAAYAGIGASPESAYAAWMADLPRALRSRVVRFLRYGAAT